MLQVSFPQTTYSASMQTEIIIVRDQTRQKFQRPLKVRETHQESRQLDLVAGHSSQVILLAVVVPESV